MTEENSQEPSLVTTADGSHSLYNAALNEHYHSKYGALQESVYVFIRKGFEVLQERGLKEISVLEMGLGTGMNCFLTYLEALSTGISIRYTALEAYPIGLSTAKVLNYPALLGAENEQEAFLKIHSGAWNEYYPIGNLFELKKLRTPMQQFDSEEQYDLVYYDAFGPRAQPELWTLEIFEKLARLMRPGGVLVTYCAKGDVRRNMLQAGLRAERLPGPPGKREMLRAMKPE